MKLSKLLLVVISLCLPVVVNAADINDYDNLTSIVDAGDASFVIMSEDSKLLFGSGNQNLGFDDASQVINRNDIVGCEFKAVALDGRDGCYLLRLVNIYGSEANVWGNPAYLNTQPATGWCSFLLGLNNQDGQDLKDGAVWEIRYVEGKGFSLKNVGTGLYLKDNGPAKYTTPAYFSFRVNAKGTGRVNKNVDITVNGEKRSYWLFVPKDCPENAPLVVAMHGAGGHSTDNSPRFHEIADTAKFIVVYPQGNPIYFPVFGGTVPGWDASGEDNADVAFLKAVINDVASGYRIDRKRVYCCGFSNGGMNTYAMANACSDIFAAFASISGFPINEFHLRHAGKRPVPFLHIHGKNDDFVRYRLMPVIVDEMVARNGACPVPVKTGVSGKYDKSVYEAQHGSFPYIYYEIDGMGHSDFTSNTEDGNSSLTMWKFFKRYTLDTPCDTTLKWMPRIETEGYTPQSHGWTVNSGNTLLAFGLGAKTDANQNVYNSLQLTGGYYKLCFKSQGEAGKTIGVKLQRFQTSDIVLNTTVAAGEEVTLFFKVRNDDFGQYKLTFTRQSATDDISVSNIGIFSATEDEASGVGMVPGSAKADGGCYTLGGIRVSRPSGGIYVKGGKKTVIRQ